MKDKLTMQPAAQAASQAGWQPVLDAVLLRHAARPGALLPILHAVQDTLGHVPRDAVPVIAQALNLSRAEVHGVVSFYHHFREQPPSGRVLQICRAEACQAMGAEHLLAHARQHLACAADGRSADGRFTVEAAYCLGLCASSPALMLDDAVHARMSVPALEALVATAGAAS